jgi:hypothetical protein
VFTNKAVLSRGKPFYVFPSGYLVLERLLEKEVLPYLNEKERTRVEEIEQEFKFENSQMNNQSRKDKSTNDGFNAKNVT